MLLNYDIFSSNIKRIKIKAYNGLVVILLMHQNKEKSTEWKTFWKEACRKTPTEMGRCEKGILVAAEYKRMNETIVG